MKINFENYIPDGHGYAGLVQFELKGNHLHQHFPGDDLNGKSETHTLLRIMPGVTGIRAMNEHDAISVFNHLDHQAQEYLDYDARNVDKTRVRILEFQNGEYGFLAMFGDPYYITLVTGGLATDIDDDRIRERSVKLYQNRLTFGPCCN